MGLLAKRSHHGKGRPHGAYDVDPQQTAAGAAVSGAPSRYAWVILAALFYVQVVNFVDKAVVGIAAPSIIKEFSLSASQYGWVASSFYALYAIGGLIVAAVFGHRIPPRHILTGLLIIWTVAQVPAILATSLVFLVISRLTLGAGEGAGTPTVINCCYEWFPSDQRSLPTATLFFGNTMGKIIAAPTLTFVIAVYGWRSAFGLCALLGAIATVVWLVVGRGGPLAASSPPESRPTEHRVRESARVWRNPSIIGVCVVSFCAYWVVGFSISWLAPYLRFALHYDATQTGWVMSAIYVGQSILLFALTGLSDRMLRRGASPRVARTGLIGVCLMITAAAFAGCAFIDDPVLNVALFTLASSMPAVVLALAPAIVADLVADDRRNRTIGIIFAGITVSGFFAPVTTGMLVDAQDGSFFAALLAISVVALIGAVTSIMLVDPAHGE